VNVTATRRVSSADIDRQHGAILQALDKLFKLKVPRGPGPGLRRVRSTSAAIDQRDA
jgi:hypothetical protein